MTPCHSPGALEAGEHRNNQMNWICDTSARFQIQRDPMKWWWREQLLRETCHRWQNGTPAGHEYSLMKRVCVCMCVCDGQRFTSDASLLTIIPVQWTHSPSHSLTRSVISLSCWPFCLISSFSILSSPYFCFTPFLFLWWEACVLLYSHTLSVCLYLSMYLSVFLPICLSISIFCSVYHCSIHLLINLSTIHLSVSVYHLPFCLSVHICLFCYIYPHSIYRLIDLSLSFYRPVILSFYLSAFSVVLLIILFTYCSINLLIFYSPFYPSFYLSVVLSIILSFCLSVVLLIVLSIHRPIYCSVLLFYLSVILSHYLLFYRSMYCSVCLFLSICLSDVLLFDTLFYISFYVSICLSVFDVISFYLLLYISVLSLYMCICLSLFYQSFYLSIDLPTY